MKNNQKKGNQAFQTIFGLLVLLVVIAIFLAGVEYLLKLITIFIGEISNISSNMDAVIIVSLITGTVSIAGVIISSVVGKVVEYRQQTNRYLFEKREEPYSEFVDLVYKIQQTTKNGNLYSEEEMMKDITHFSKKLTLWGSSKTVKKWLEFRMNSVNGTIKPEDTLFILEEILFEIRKDMGQGRKGLKKGDLLRFFINDIDNVLLKVTKKA